ncbi:hypothetical protein DFH06DRAFT_1239012 [Mycena polygramma]|nr:hypothetical protein DFH06DRAFT_1239012 [Mycena polygramma]
MCGCGAGCACPGCVLPRCRRQLRCWRYRRQLQPGNAGGDSGGGGRHCADAACGGACFSCTILGLPDFAAAVGFAGAGGGAGAGVKGEGEGGDYAFDGVGDPCGVVYDGGYNNNATNDPNSNPNLDTITNPNPTPNALEGYGDGYDLDLDLDLDLSADGGFQAIDDWIREVGAGALPVQAPFGFEGFEGFEFEPSHPPPLPPPPPAHSQSASGSSASSGAGGSAFDVKMEMEMDSFDGMGSGSGMGTGTGIEFDGGGGAYGAAWVFDVDPGAGVDKMQGFTGNAKPPLTPTSFLTVPGPGVHGHGRSRSSSSASSEVSMPGGGVFGGRARGLGVSHHAHLPPALPPPAPVSAPAHGRAPGLAFPPPPPPYLDDGMLFF